MIIEILLNYMELGPARTTQIFVCFAKNKTVNRKPFSSANDFFYLPWFSQLSPNFKNAVEEYSEAYNSLTGDKVLCSMTAIINRVILSRENDQLCSLLGRRSKGKGKGIRTRDHARGRREEGSFPFSLVGPTRSREPKFPRPLFLLTPATQATNYANKVAKTKNWWLQDFQTFCKRKTLQVVRHSANRALYSNIVRIKKSVKRSLPRPRRKKSVAEAFSFRGGGGRRS